MIIKMGSTNWCLSWVCDSDVWANCPCIRLPSPSLRLFSSSGRKIRCHKNILNIHIVSVSSVFISIWFVYGCMCVYKFVVVQTALITSFHVMTPHSRPLSVINRRCSPVTLMMQWAWQNTRRIIEEHWTKKHTQVNKLPFILTAPALQCFQESDVAAQVE